MKPAHTYSFSVPASQVDFKRIIDENPEARVIVVQASESVHKGCGAKHTRLTLVRSGSFEHSNLVGLAALGTCYRGNECWSVFDGDHARRALDVAVTKVEVYR